MDLKDEVNDQSLDDVTNNDVSTNNTCTNDVTGDEIKLTDVTETNDITDADKKEVSVATPIVESGEDLEQAANQETNEKPAESEPPQQDVEIENTAKTETENSEEHTASQASESNLEPKSNGHMSEKQERFLDQYMTLKPILTQIIGFDNNRIRTMKYR